MSSTSPANALSLHDLGAFDPTIADISLGQGGERRCLCPFCGHSKPRNAAHRSLSLNTSTGLWRCHRCGGNGKVRDAWAERSPLPRRERARAGLAQAFALPPAAPSAAPRSPDEATAPALAATAPALAATAPALAATAPALAATAPALAATAPALAATAPALVATADVAVESWKRDLRGLRALDGTRAAAYLNGRGLPADVAGAAGARFSTRFHGTTRPRLSPARPSGRFARRSRALCGRTRPAQSAHFGG